MSTHTHRIITLVALFNTGRPNTGLYAFLLALVSFKFFGWDDWQIGIGVGLIFAVLTMSIMRFNDLIDAVNDRRKGKYFATNNNVSLWHFWRIEAVILIISIAVLMQWSAGLAVFCIFVWLLGLAYSFMPRWYVVQNVVVALCSGSPALCAIVYFGTFETHGLATFFLFTTLIWLSEVHKDIEDRRTDVGYKRTFPTQIGGIESVLLLIASLHIVAVFVLLHPVGWMLLVGITLVPKLAYDQGVALMNRNQINKAMETMKHTIIATGVILYVY